MNKKNIGNNAMETAGKMTASQVIRILAKHRTIVTEDEDKIVLGFVSKMSKIAVGQYLILKEKLLKIIFIINPFGIRTRYGLYSN